MALIGLYENARKKGSAELLVLAQLETRPRHGYEIGVEIERRSEGAVSFQTACPYPVLYRLEAKGLIAGQWVEAAGQRRRRRYYKLTRAGRKVLSEQRRSWNAVMAALQRAGGAATISDNLRSDRRQAPPAGCRGRGAIAAHGGGVRRPGFVACLPRLNYLKYGSGSGTAAPSFRGDDAP